MQCAIFKKGMLEKLVKEEWVVWEGRMIDKEGTYKFYEMLRYEMNKFA
jgi:hypothetical protein